MLASLREHGTAIDQPALALDSLRKSFGSNLVVDRCDLVLQRGEIVALLGASGCGKSTLLNMIAGFEQPDYGTIMLDGERIDSIPPHRRNIAMVFQSYALFPHLGVADNIAYGLRARRVTATEIAARTNEMVRLLKLDGLETRYPAQLSGGQRQRVAVARALAIRPRILLLDEAFSALDRSLRENMQLELSMLLRRINVTTVLVTHDQREAFALADRVAIMEAGRIVQIGTPEDVYRNPASGSVLRFLGTTNRVFGNILNTEHNSRVQLRNGISFEPRSDRQRNVRGPSIWIDIRAEDIRLSENPTPVHASRPATILLRTFLGSQERVVVQIGDDQIVVDNASQNHLNEKPRTKGDKVYIDFNPSECRLSDAD